MLWLGLGPGLNSQSAWLICVDDPEEHPPDVCDGRKSSGDAVGCVAPRAAEGVAISIGASGIMTLYVWSEAVDDVQGELAGDCGAACIASSRCCAL